MTVYGSMLAQKVWRTWEAKHPQLSSGASSISYRHPLRSVMAIAALICLIWIAVAGKRIWIGPQSSTALSGDAAVVLGAAVDGNRPSPVFRERIRHGVTLYHAGRVRKLIFTGGAGQATEPAESIIAKRYALRHGVPEDDILIETSSKTTRQNLLEARRLMFGSGLRSALLVSDPLHMERAMLMAADLGLNASPSPTPSTLYRSWRSKVPFLAREVVFYSYYLATGH